MSTTAIVAEILIIGFQGAVWMTLLLATLLPDAVSVETLKALKGWETLATIVALAAIYTIGVIGDRVADSVYSLFRRAKDKREKKEREQRGFPAESDMRLRVTESKDGKAQFIEYQRSRFRIARATAPNLLLILVAALIYLAQTGADGVAFAVTGGILAAAFVITVLAAERIQEAYMKRLKQAYQMWKEDRQVAEGG